MQKMKEQGEETQELTIKPNLVDNIHDADGKGTPLYGNFRYEDWVLLSFRYELHLLSYAFAMDVNDADRPAIPEAHVAHYYNVYFKTKLDPAKMDKKTFEEVLKVLKGPCELTESELASSKCKVLKSKLDKETNTEDFVKAIEEYRRDRFRRMDAGDESAILTFPRPVAGAKAPAKAGPPVAKAGVKRPASLDDADENPAKKMRPETPAGPPGKAAVAKAPVSKAPVAKRKPA